VQCACLYLDVAERAGNRVRRSAWTSNVATYRVRETAAGAPGSCEGNRDVENGRKRIWIIM